MAKMATDYKVGDKIRLVHEGTVTHASALGRSISIDGIYRVLGKGETVEVLERKVEPFAEGALVQRRAGTAVRTRDGDWIWTSCGEVSTVLTDEDNREAVARGYATVLYEPSA